MKIDFSGSRFTSQTNGLDQWYRRSAYLLGLTLTGMCVVTIVGYWYLYSMSSDRVLLHQLKQELAQKHEQPRHAVPSRNNSFAELTEYITCLAPLLPDDVRLDSVIFEANKTIRFEGVAKNLNDLTGFITRLKSETCYTKSVVSEIKRDSLNNSDYYLFTLISDLS